MKLQPRLRARPPRWSWPFVALLFALIVGFWSTSIARAATYTVTTLDDNAIDDGQCSLREAIAAANNAPLNDDCGPGSPNDDTITFNVSGTIHLQSTLPDIAAAGALTIDGGNNITISGDSDNDGDGDVRLFQLAANSSLTLQRMVLTHGYTMAGDGAAVSGSNANLTLLNCTVQNHRAGGGNGGAINLRGNGDTSFEARNCVFQNNVAEPMDEFTGHGGAVYLTNMQSTIADTRFENNKCEVVGDNQGDGGAIYANEGRTDIANATFDGNQAKNGGAIHWEAHQATMRDTVLQNNRADGNDGYGGGIRAIDTDLSMERVTFQRNQAWVGGGLAYSDHSSYSPPSELRGKYIRFLSNTATLGGGVNLYGGVEATFAHSTWRGNQAGVAGGWKQSGTTGTYGSYTSIVANSTFAENSDFALGLRAGGQLEVLNTTIAHNDKGIDTPTAAAARLVNTILQDNTGGNCDANGVTDGGHNLSSDGTCNFTAPTSRNNTNARLGALTGAPAYYPLLAGSPALDQGDAATCAGAVVNNESQNGVTRPQDGDGDGTAVCDIGSYEASAAATPTPTVSPTPTRTPTPTVSPTPTRTPTPAVGAPPRGQMTADSGAWPLVTWNAVWANIQNTVNLAVTLVHPIPANSTYVAGSLNCIAGGSTVVTRCAYNAARNQIEVEATLAADFGGTFAAWPPKPFPLTAWMPMSAALDTTVSRAPHLPSPLPRVQAALAHPLTIRYQTRAQAGVTQLLGQGLAYWDENNDGQVTNLDPNVQHDTPVRTDDPAQPGLQDPTLARQPALPETGFPPRRDAPRGLQPATEADLGSVWIEIPRLQVQERLWGVPSHDDLAWLTDVGWLWSSAFPGHPGNSVLTAHNYLANGLPGPFAALHQLRYGDRIRVHAYGTVYEFAVTQVRYTDPEDLWALRDANDSHAWLTLITCAQWDDADQAYRYRLVVRAVLVRWYQSEG